MIFNCVIDTCFFRNVVKQNFLYSIYMHSSSKVIRRIVNRPLMVEFFMHLSLVMILPVMVLFDVAGFLEFNPGKIPVLQ